IHQSGMQKGDKIVSINNTPITNTGSIVSIINNSKSYDGLYSERQANKKLTELRDLNRAYVEDEIIPKGVTVRLPEVENETVVSYTKEMEQGIIRYQNDEIKLDDKLIKLREVLKKGNSKYYESDGQYTLADISKAICDNQHPLNFTVSRNGKLIDLKPIYADENGKIGIEMAQKEILNKTKGIKSVVKTGTKYLWYNTYNMCYGLGQIFTGKVPLKDLHGIVAITKIGGDIIQNSGIYYGLLLTAIISMDLAIVNFLPIPALDGGHVLFLIIEKIRGRRLNDETVEKIGTFFFALLIALMFVIIFNDIVWLKG
ncbi:site-2 protease family protein, partial [bacterium]|nr:site-2 protease family protein [bacterium]